MHWGKGEWVCVVSTEKTLGMWKGKCIIIIIMRRGLSRESLVKQNVLSIDLLIKTMYWQSAYAS